MLKNNRYNTNNKKRVIGRLIEPAIDSSKQKWKEEEQRIFSRCASVVAIEQLLHRKKN